MMKSDSDFTKKMPMSCLKQVFWSQRLHALERLHCTENRQHTEYLLNTFI